MTGQEQVQDQSHTPEVSPTTAMQTQTNGDRKPKPTHIKTRKFRLISQNSPELDELFARIYPARYMELLQQLDDWFAQRPAEFFRSTNIQWIKKLVVNSNPDLKPVKLRQHTTQDFLFNTRTIWCAEIMVYFAYRNKAIRDRSLQLIASYLSDRTLISEQELIHFYWQMKARLPLIQHFTISAEPMILSMACFLLRKIQKCSFLGLNWTGLSRKAG